MKTHPIWEAFSCLARFLPLEDHQCAHLGTLVVFGRFSTPPSRQTRKCAPYQGAFSCLPTFLPSQTLPMCPLGHVDVPFEHQSPPSGCALIFEWRGHSQ